MDLFQFRLSIRSLEIKRLDILLAFSYKIWILLWRSWGKKSKFFWLQRITWKANLIELFQSIKTDVPQRQPVSRAELLAGLIKLVAFPLFELACRSDKTGEGGELLSKMSPNKKTKKGKMDSILSELIRACSTLSFAECLLMWTSGLFWFSGARFPPPPPAHFFVSSLSNIYELIAHVHRRGPSFLTGSEHQQTSTEEETSYENIFGL